MHDLLIRFCAAFLDQGLAKWQLPRRDEGFLRSFCALYGQGGGSPEGWMQGLAPELAELDKGNIDPLESIRQSLEILGVPESDWEDYISATLLALRGWAGMLRQIEVRGDRAVHPVPAGSLVEFLARALAARKMGLVKDPQGILLPEDLWTQCLPEAEFIIGAIEAYELRKMVLSFHTAEDNGE